MASLRTPEVNFIPVPYLLSARPSGDDLPALPTEHEHKYLLDPDAARFVWAAASLHLRPLEDPARPISFARTTYFDTHDLAYYRSARGQVSRRLRVREYASATAPGERPRLAERCYLELKQSANGLRHKTRLALDAQAVAGHLARHPDAPLSPVLTTWYQRSSLANADKSLRITLDDGVSFCAPSAVGSPCPQSPLAVVERWPTMVLEIKRSAAAPLWLRRALHGLDEARTFSKFNAGMLAVVGRPALTQLAQRDASAALSAKVISPSSP